ncbi:MAG: hypothetical protein ACREV6_21520 [Clostridium sp.]|uniref:hypothetical protein n=1 Tax=Clostridium sp. TaxID=1506 RepID=UPI003D6CD24D
MRFLGMSKEMAIDLGTTNTLIYIFNIPNNSSENNSRLQFVTHTLTEKDIIGDIKVGLTNGLGEDKGKIFLHAGIQYGITGLEYERLIKMAKTVFKNRQIQNSVSFVFVKNILFEWVEKKYTQEIDLDFTDYLDSEIDKVVKECEIWMPVPFTAIDESFVIGKIEFKPITKDILDNWIKPNENSNMPEEQLNGFKKFKKEIHSDFQGYAAGVYKCKAEKNRAEEIAYEYFSESLSLLRIFSRANLSPKILNASYEYGFKMFRSKTYFLYKPSSDGISYTTTVIDRGINWHIGTDDIKIMDSYIKKINDLLSISELNDFQEKLLHYIMVYSKNTLRYDISDKILYILVAVEGMLLKSDTEPIQQNVGERLAFVLGKTAKERMDIVSNLREVYSLRSKFVHHGKDIEDENKILEKFMTNIWVFSLWLIDNYNIFNTKDEFLKSIDLKKFS